MTVIKKNGKKEQHREEMHQTVENNSNPSILFSDVKNSFNL